MIGRVLKLTLWVKGHKQILFSEFFIFISQRNVLWHCCFLKLLIIFCHLYVCVLSLTKRTLAIYLLCILHFPDLTVDWPKLWKKQHKVIKKYSKAIEQQWQKMFLTLANIYIQLVVVKFLHGYLVILHCKRVFKFAFYEHLPSAGFIYTRNWAKCTLTINRITTLLSYCYFLYKLMHWSPGQKSLKRKWLDKIV